MKSPATFSIVIPTYNRGHHILPTLKSIQAQSFKDYEVIVVDDGSSDNTAAVVASLNDDRFVYYWKENGERGAARNYGADRSNGEYISFLDSDDFMHPDALKVVNDEILRLGKINVLTCGYEIRTPGMKLKSRVNGFKENELGIFTMGNPFACGSVFIHRSVFAEFRFCELREISRSEDWEYWIRLVSNFGYKVLNRVVLYVIDHDQRSVRIFNPNDLISCKELSIQEAFKNEKVNEYYAAQRNTIISYGYSYISLHLALSGYKKLTVQYLFRAVGKMPSAVFTRRFYAIVKHLILTW